MMHTNNFLWSYRLNMSRSSIIHFNLFNVKSGTLGTHGISVLMPISMCCLVFQTLKCR